MKIYVLSYVATAIVFLACDIVWLALMGNRLYRPLLGDLLLPGFRAAPAVLFYLIYMAGIVFFAISPAVETGRWTSAFGHGAALGFVAYAAYDLTNQATLRNWSTTITAIDLCWGTALTAIAAALGFVIASAIARATAG